MTKENFDALAREALSEDEFAFMNQTEEQNIFEMLLGLYKGKQKWLSVYIMIMIFIAFGFTIFFAVRFFESEALKDMIMYAAGGFLGLMMTGMLKIWFWMQIHNNSILRELKRIELQMSILAMNFKK